MQRQTPAQRMYAQSLLEQEGNREGVAQVKEEIRLAHRRWPGYLDEMLRLIENHQFTGGDFYYIDEERHLPCGCFYGHRFQIPSGSISKMFMSFRHELYPTRGGQMMTPLEEFIESIQRYDTVETSHYLAMFVELIEQVLDEEENAVPI